MTPSFDYYYYQLLPESLRDSLSCANWGLLWSNMSLYHGQPWLIPAHARAVWPWLTMVKPWLYHCQTIVHHGWKPCLPFNHGVTMVAHALSILSPGKLLLKPCRDYSILNMKGNTKWILVVLVVIWRHRANGLFWAFLLPQRSRSASRLVSISCRTLFFLVVAITTKIQSPFEGRLERRIHNPVYNWIY